MSKKRKKLIIVVLVIVSLISIYLLGKTITEERRIEDLVPESAE